jgi:Peptidase family M23
MKRLVALLPVLIAFQAGAPPALAWTWPVEGPVLRPFVLGDDPYAGGQHRGVDIAGSGGAPVGSPAAGVVSFAGTVPGGGRTVTVQTADGYSVTLVHLGSIAVGRDARLPEGAPVGTIGPSGDREHSVPYVHLGIRATSDAHGYLDPLSFLPTPETPPPGRARSARRAGSGSPTRSDTRHSRTPASQDVSGACTRGSRTRATLADLRAGSCASAPSAGPHAGERGGGAGTSLEATGRCRRDRARHCRKRADEPDPGGFDPERGPRSRREAPGRTPASRAGCLSSGSGVDASRGPFRSPRRPSRLSAGLGPASRRYDARRFGAGLRPGGCDRATSRSPSQALQCSRDKRPARGVRRRRASLRRRRIRPWADSGGSSDS